MAHRCLLCGAADSACGPRTTSIAVDAPVRGRVVGNRVVDVTSLQSLDMTEEEREEFAVMSDKYSRRKLRNQIMGDMGHTSLAYVRCPDGVTRKMKPDDAEKYVELTEGAEIVSRGTREIAGPNEVIGATKARIGRMFDDNGRQRADVQPLTTRSFVASDMTRSDVHTPAIGASGAEEDNASAHAPRRARVPRTANAAEETTTTADDSGSEQS